MGVCNTIGIEAFPKQGSFQGKAVSVCFHYDTSRRVHGKVVRDDIEEPFITIIKLTDGRYVLASECQYSPTTNP